MRLIVISLALIGLVAGAQAQDPAQDGAKIAREFCGPCHAIGKSDRSRHTDAPPFRTFSRSFDLDQFAERLERGLASNHPDMPEFKFNEDNARAVRAYLRTIQE